MPQQRTPRTLRDVSHLFLSGGESARARVPRRSEAVIWIAAVGSSVNRAHLAAGAAAACAKLGMQVSLAEVSRNLPNIGYYFGLEPADYLGPAVDRATLGSGAWGESVRFCFSTMPSSLGRCAVDAAQQDAPHAIIVAFSCPAGRARSPFFAGLGVAAAALSDQGEGAARHPDCVIVAADGPHAVQARGLSSDVRARFPGAVVFSIAHASERGLAIDADESLVLPRELGASVARRMPPTDGSFDELVASVFQILSLRRRKAVVHAASG